MGYLPQAELQCVGAFCLCVFVCACVVFFGWLDCFFFLGGGVVCGGVVLGVLFGFFPRLLATRILNLQSS